MKHALSLLPALSALAGACVGVSEAPDAGDTPGIAVNIAALNLTGVGDVVWDLEVDNGDGDVVWQRRITSSGYGDSAGSASYVAPCDADPDVALNRVKVWVVGVYADDVSAADAGSFNASHDGVTGTPVPFQNPTATAPLYQDVTCAENADVAVRFDVALMRPAEQGFFDIAVNFNDIFCSAKLDCCADTDANGCAGDGTEDIDLLFAPGGARDRTIVLGFACTAGAAAGVDTTLYLDSLGLDCSAPNDSASFVADVVINPAAGPGNLCTAGSLATCPAITTGAAQADTYLFQVATYRGEEDLQVGAVDAQKVYWNVALGVKAAVSGCRLKVTGTADDANNDDDHVDAGVIAAGAVYPYIQWDAALGSCASEELTFGGTTAAVRTEYTTTGGDAEAFAYGFGPTLPAGGFCDPVCVHGACIAHACACETGWTGDACDLSDHLVAYWKLDDASGTTAVDETMYGHDATLAGDATWTTGVQGGALSLDGSGDYANVAKPLPTELRPAALTIEAWVYPNSYTNPVGDVVGGIVASQWDPTQSCWSMSFEYRNNGAHSGVLGGIHWQVGGTSGYWANGSQGSTATALPLNTWTHVAAVAEPGARYEVYFDGVKVTNWTAGPAIAYDASCRLAIGWNDHNGSSVRWFDGLVDDVRIYDEARTPAQIQADYDATKP